MTESFPAHLSFSGNAGTVLRGLMTWGPPYTTGAGGGRKGWANPSKPQTQPLPNLRSQASSLVVVSVQRPLWGPPSQASGEGGGESRSRKPAPYKSRCHGAPARSTGRAQSAPHALPRGPHCPHQPPGTPPRDPERRSQRRGPAESGRPASPAPDQLSKVSRPHALRTWESILT